MIISLIIIVIFNSSIIFSSSEVESIPMNELKSYENYLESGKAIAGKYDLRFNEMFIKYNKNGYYGKDEYDAPSGNSDEPFTKVGERVVSDNLDLTGNNKIYKILTKLDYNDIDTWYKEDEFLMNDYELMKREEFKETINALDIGERKITSSGYGRYGLMPGKNLIGFIDFAYRFYEKSSGEDRVGVEEGKVCPMEYLKYYKEVNYRDSEEEIEKNADNKVEEIGLTLRSIYKKCLKEWEYEGKYEEIIGLDIFKNLEDMYMSLVYLYPGLEVIKSAKIDVNELEEEDRTLVMAVMYDKYGGVPIIPTDNIKALTKRIGDIGKGNVIELVMKDVLDIGMAKKIFTYKIEVENANKVEELGRWLSFYEEMYDEEYEPLSKEDYNKFMKAVNEARREYGKDVKKGVIFDYGYVENPEEFSSKISLEEAIKKLIDHLEKIFKDSKFYKNRDNSKFVAKSYMMVNNMVNNEVFSHITDIYATKLELVEHSIGYSNNKILLADTSVVELKGKYGTYTDTDNDGILDYNEANEMEEYDISDLVREYCKYNDIKGEKEEEYISKYSKINMYAYISNPVLPDTDFDGIDDNRDRYKLDNHKIIKEETSYFDLVNYDYNQDYRYFFMPSDNYYQELSDMSVNLSNLISDNGKEKKKWSIPMDSIETYGIERYMSYIGLDNIRVYDLSREYSDCNVCKYAIGSREIKNYNNITRKVVAITIGDIASRNIELL